MLGRQPLKPTVLETNRTWEFSLLMDQPIRDLVILSISRCNSCIILVLTTLMYWLKQGSQFARVHESLVLAECFLERIETR